MHKILLISLPLLLVPLGAFAQDSKPALPKGVRLVKPLSPNEAEKTDAPKKKNKGKDSKTKAKRDATAATTQAKEKATEQSDTKAKTDVKNKTDSKPKVNDPQATPNQKANDSQKEASQKEASEKSAVKPPQKVPSKTEKTANQPTKKPATKRVGKKKRETNSQTKAKRADAKGKTDEKKKINTELPKPQTLEARPKLAPRPPSFVEGELVHVGQIGILPWDDRFGMVIGVERLGEIYYGSVNVGVNHTFKFAKTPLQLTLGVPLRFELLDARPDQRFNNVGRFRAQDWDEASDFAKVIQRLKFGTKEQRFFLDINRYSSHTIGHGALMKRYDANLNFNTSRVGVQLDAFSDYIGFESMVNDITGPNVLGGLVFIKPLSLINNRNYILRSFSIGVSAATDLKAPIRNALDFEDVDKDGRRSQELKIDQSTFQPKSLTTQVANYGFDVEIKLIDTREIDWKMYGDYSLLESGVPTEDNNEIRAPYVGLESVVSSGITWGHLIRSNLGVDPIHALRIRLEYRNYDPNYLPSYFDSLYEVQRVQYLPSGEVVDLANATKLQRVLGRDPNGERVHGGYFEASWRMGDSVAFSLGLEMNNQTPDNHAFVHMELPQLGSWQFMTSYHRRNALKASELLNGGFASNDIWLMQTRYRLASWFHWNLSVMTPFGFGPESVFRNSLQVNLSAELGFSLEDE